VSLIDAVERRQRTMTESESHLVSAHQKVMLSGAANESERTPGFRVKQPSLIHGLLNDQQIKGLNQNFIHSDQVSLHSQGQNCDKLRHQSMTPQGTTPRGTPMGATSMGEQPKGFTPKGMAPRGVTPKASLFHSLAGASDL
jgi:hypothetical protein